MEVTLPQFDTFYSPLRAVSVSILDAFSRCPRRFFYSFGCSLGKEEHLALKFGEAFHAAKPQAFFGKLDAAMLDFDKVWQERDRFGDDKRNRTRALLMLEDYALQTAGGRGIYLLQDPPAGKITLGDQISDYEIPFILDIGLPVPLIGRVDGLVKHRDTGELWALETKTSSEMSTRLFDNFTMNPQTCLYALALRSFGIDVKGTMVEVHRVSAKNVGTMCQPVPISDQLAADGLRWARLITSQILACEKEKDFPKYLSGCASYAMFGSPGYQCEFMPMCSVGRDWLVTKEMYVKKDYPTMAILDAANHEGAKS